MKNVKRVATIAVLVAMVIGFGSVQTNDAHTLALDVQPQDKNEVT
ncbi:hypothetical protein ACE1TF_06890 [Geomicrobium sp. JSM 1781026]|nr:MULTISPECIES: hypothetical protein [unclassified Geomicrobium]